MSFNDTVQVSVTWKDRMLSSFSFRGERDVFLGGGDDADVIVPGLPVAMRYCLLRMGSVPHVLVAPGMNVELQIQGENRTWRNADPLMIQSGEVVRIGLPGDLLALHIRRLPRGPEALAEPILDLETSETAGILAALALTGFLSLSLKLRPPEVLESDPQKIEMITRKVRVLFSQPEAQPSVEKVSPPAEPAKAPAQAPRATPSRHKSPHKPISSKPAGLIEALSARGIRENLERTLSDGDSLIRASGESTGANGPREFGTTGTKETASGATSGTVDGGPIGTSGRTGGKGTHIGGIGQRAGVQISVSTQLPDVTGGMDREAIRRVIREHLAEVRFCYERQLQRTPDLYGKLVLEWDIETGGRVTQARIKKDSLNQPEVGHCLVERLKNWRFPDPPKDHVGRVSYPFVFSAK